MAPDTHDTQSQSRQRRSWRSFAGAATVLAVAPAFAILLTLFVFQPYEVEGMSMERTLQDKDRVIILKVPRTVSRITQNPYIPQRYDIIVFKSRLLGEQLIKRVIGLPGERVVIADGRVIVYNRDHLSGFEPDANQNYAVHLPDTPGSVDVTIPNDEIFVLGDNRSNSKDSSEFGPISADDIIGRLVLRLLPLDRLKTF